MTFGLCGLIYKLEKEKIITEKEFLALSIYLKKNKKTNVFWFPFGEKEPLIKWLQKHIKKQDNFWNKIKNL
jgi:hypothetical protein